LRGDVPWIVAPFALLWLAAPAVALWISRAPQTASHLAVSAQDALALRLVARRTWRFFEQFVTADDHMLPPDNFQEDPRAVLAHRTSPTNLGLYLLSTVSARDLGWIGTLDATERLEATLATMESLQRFRGHFFNWYDTRDLRPLDPLYVSSVDSGNLAAHLVTLASATRDWRDTPAPTAVSVAGVRDALQLTREAARAFAAPSRALSVHWREFDEHVAKLETTLGDIENWRGDIPGQYRYLIDCTTALVDIARTLSSDSPDAASDDLLVWCRAVHRAVESWQRDATQTREAADALSTRLARIGASALAMADAMDFAFLLDPQRRLLSIGYRAADGTLDPSCYDLLASEARLASFFAIAKGDVASRHWFRLGRPVTPVGHGAALTSWSGSMFEYLMPSLVMRAPAGSILEQTSRLIVRRQIAYGAVLEVPWGISESAYNARDIELTYQYSNFGVPGLGLKRGLGEDTVVAPYATALAAMVEPELATRNLARLAALGALGRYGFYEALDYTRSRLPDDTRFVIVRAYMAHHQGMTIVAIANVLLQGIMRSRFHAEPRVQATELLLQERTPRDVSVVHPRVEEVHAAVRIDDVSPPDVRRLHTANDPTPQVHCCRTVATR
jgi:cyclic beta-1,2-glucan synthetase